VSENLAIFDENQIMQATKQWVNEICDWWLTKS
jgi:hypothetical protein